ncbi:MAG: exodeoxyribonuclease VII small subunit [Betaproteobacteria bacterium AqS2]|uniref:Exodeoxyribonuclease 7 small subunit n=1 Tax=Candidatus Amphirhobacter heronislandensis TaxID=1732024 RepID=A0A930XXZ1_9GAMM|nr:exodeoxyribonuclease VII small subunit [Betaproteobacteria bacterium AqS2]
MAKEARTKKAAEKAPSFEEALAEIEDSVAAIEAGELPLDEVIKRFKSCSTLIAQCKDMLKEVQQQIDILDGKDK